MKASVIIPTYNACERLLNCLTALNYQDCPKNSFEVILINNGSSDNTAQMLARFRPKYKLIVVHLPQVMSRAYARNQGIMKAQNELIIFHDSDMLANGDFIRKHIQSHKDENTIVCGSLWHKIFTFYYEDFDYEQKEKMTIFMKKYLGEQPYNKKLIKHRIVNFNRLLFKEYKKLGCCEDSFFSYLYNKYGKTLEGYPFNWVFFVTRNCSVRRESLINIGLFDEGFTGWGYEDSDIGFRLVQAGHKIIVKPDILSLHQEHPKAIEDVQTTGKNKKYFMDKHETINPLILMLFEQAEINYYDIDFIMRDIHHILQQQENHRAISLFQQALIDLKNKIYDNIVPIITDELKELELDAFKQYGSFTKAASKLFGVVYGIDI